jgi:NAD(P)-dependent dehydrogenase (short-subunit alcohol dehydrogenase family)
MELGAGKVAVVTGGAGGIGYALATAFAEAGMSVVVADVQDDALEQAATSMSDLGVEVLAIRTDVSKLDQVEALAAATIERFGAVHVVCNNAGVAAKGDPWIGPISSWEWTMGVNFWGVVYGVRAFLPHIVMAGGGHIVNTASMAGLYPGFGPSYDASKHAVVAMTEGLYTSLSTAGLPVGVSCLCPGWVKTGIIDSERNWPAELGERPELDAARAVSEKHVRRAVDEGLPPRVVADLVLSAIRDNRYWIFPHPDFVDIAMERFHRIGEGLDPSPPEEFPGMPPRSQMIAEVMAAMQPPPG